MKVKFARGTLLYSNICSNLCLGGIGLAQAQENQQNQQNHQNSHQVVIQAERQESAGAREVLAGKIVLGREWLDRSSASTVAEALRRESSISVSSSGKISLKGLSGYTQILLDGQTATAGTSPLEMDPSLIERVEIIHSASADTGAFGLAGTINVVTRNRRKPLPRQLNVEVGRNDLNDLANVSMQGGWRDTDGMTFNLMGTADRSNTKVIGEDIWYWSDGQGVTRSSVESTENQTLRRRATLSPSINWKPSSNDEVQLKASLSGGSDQIRMFNAFASGIKFSAGGIRPVKSILNDVNDVNYAMLDSSWRHKYPSGSAATLKLSFTRENLSQTRGSHTVWSDTVFNGVQNRNDAVKDYVKAQWQLAFPNQAGHKVQVATATNVLMQTNQQRTRINGAEARLDILSDYQADLLGLDWATWIQDDWNVTEELDVKLGLRNELRRRRWQSEAYQSNLNENLLSPSLNLAWRIDPSGERIVSLGFARSFSLIGPEMLNPRPDIAGLSLCSSNGQCGANDPNQADRVGNPHLRHERAWGLDLAFEDTLRDNSQWSVRAYHRWIQNNLAWVTQRETVAWASVPRWVYRPTNLGGANAFGVSLGVDAAIRDWMEGAVDLGVSASVQWNQSHVKHIQGPDNRIEGQQPWSGRLGFTYKTDDKTWELQSDYLLNPAYWWQANDESRIYTRTHRELSFKGIWHLSQNRRVVASFQDLLPSNDAKLSQFFGTSKLILDSSQRRRTMFNLRFESQFD